MRIKKIGILTEEQISTFTTIKNMGVESLYSDLARITGGTYSDSTGIGEYWCDGLPSINKPNKRSKKEIGIYGKLVSVSENKRRGVRITINLNDIEGFDKNKPNEFIVKYPQTVMNGVVGKTIDKMFVSNSKLLFKTGRQYDVNDKIYDEYEVMGIRFIQMCNESGISKTMMNDGSYVERNQLIYVKVEEIPFIFDNDVLYSYSCVFSYPFDTGSEQFSSSKLCNYLNNGFLKSLNDDLNNEAQCIPLNEEPSEGNRYNFQLENITEEEIIEICIRSNIAVFLHGETGTGKTERMLSLDKNLELIDFGCTSSDGFTGIIAKDFSSKELFLYEPYWYKNLCRKCDEHPELVHILFLEELPNAKSDVQKVAFEVALNKTLTNSGYRLHLPKNAVVCGAGNEAKESRSSNGLSEPLFGRFAHVYINTNSNDWLKWALKRKNEGRTLEYIEQEDIKTIHPAIIDYITVNGNKVLRTPYDGVKPNADPRKWALASKALYQCNNPNVLRAFVGEEITQDFIKFCKLNLLTIDDVINDRWTKEQLPTDASLKWHTVMCLSSVDDEHFEKVRSFVENLGKEFLAIFDFEWSKNDDERIMKLYRANQPSYVKKMVLNGNR